MTTINVSQLLTDFNLWTNSAPNSESFHSSSQTLYKMYLNAFKLSIEEDKYKILKEYQDNLFDLIDSLRDSDETTLKLFLEFLDKENPYLADLILICWCLPRADDWLSVTKYNMVYKNNINKYNQIVINIINHSVVKNFCIETLTKTNNAPIHCIDYLWYYVSDAISLEFYFVNTKHQGYLAITVEEEQTNSGVCANLKVGLDIEHIINMGLGNIGHKTPFKNVIKSMVMDETMIKVYSDCHTRDNYLRQRNAVMTKL